uniref:Uncharacterized protein n=1 Tax=Anguilla anguilla TaxID=7936 RepID=A0A0E9SWC2_ANGAN
MTWPVQNFPVFLALKISFLASSARLESLPCCKMKR